MKQIVKHIKINFQGSKLLISNFILGNIIIEEY